MSAHVNKYTGLIPLTELAILPYRNVKDPPSIPALRQYYDVKNFALVQYELSKRAPRQNRTHGLKSIYLGSMKNGTVISAPARHRI